MKKNNKTSIKTKSFTLIELMIIIGIISIITTTILTILKPSEILKNLRDTRRINDLKNIEKYILLLESEHKYGVLPFYGTSSIVYISLPDNSPTCSSWINQLPSLPSGYQYNCVATPTNIDSTGWIPINFSQSSLLNIQKLPIDPINRPPYYYTYVSGGSYELTAKLESFEKGNKYHISSKDGGDHPLLYEVGDNKTLTPLEVQGRGATYDQLTYSDPSLVGYWSFDEGTGTIAYDSSGYNNNGTLYNFNWTATSGWIDGKVNKALSFDGVDDYVVANNVAVNTSPGAKNTVVFWMYWKGTDNQMPFGWNTSYDLYIYNNAFGFNTGNSNIEGFSGTNFLINSWHHIAAIFYNGTPSAPNVRLYIDGEEKPVTHQFGGISSRSVTPKISVSGWYGGSGYRFGGFIDEVRIYNRALSAEEIKALYEATK